MVPLGVMVVDALLGRWQTGMGRKLSFCCVFKTSNRFLPIHEIKIVAKEWDNALKVVRAQGCGSMEERQLHLAGGGRSLRAHCIL